LFGRYVVVVNGVYRAVGDNLVVVGWLRSFHGWRSADDIISTPAFWRGVRSIIWWFVCRRWLYYHAHGLITGLGSFPDAVTPTVTLP
jgi:hypothetical protein